MKKLTSEDIELFPCEAGFTDDTVLTVAIAESVLHMENNSQRKCYANHIKQYYRRYPNAGFGQICPKHFSYTEYKTWIYQKRFNKHISDYAREVSVL